MTTLVVAAAIVRDGRVLAACRSGPEQLRNKWEFPGGKVEDGESAQQALRRECLEELGSAVVVGERVGPQIALTGRTRGALALYRCALVGPEPRAGPDHVRLRWLTYESLRSVDWLITNRQLLPAVAGILQSSA